MSSINDRFGMSMNRTRHFIVFENSATYYWGPIHQCSVGDPLSVAGPIPYFDFPINFVQSYREAGLFPDGS